MVSTTPFLSLGVYLYRLRITNSKTIIKNLEENSGHYFKSCNWISNKPPEGAGNETSTLKALIYIKVNASYKAVEKCSKAWV